MWCTVGYIQYGALLIWNNFNFLGLCKCWWSPEGCRQRNKNKHVSIFSVNFLSALSTYRQESGWDVYHSIYKLTSWKHLTRMSCILVLSLIKWMSNTGQALSNYTHSLNVYCWLCTVNWTGGTSLNVAMFLFRNSISKSLRFDVQDIRRRKIGLLRWL